VDLSAGMLERAAHSGTYDELRIGELVAAMNAEPETYDLIVAADVLIYFGSLDELFEAAAGALRPAGLVAVTVERHGEDGYVIRTSGRYAHSEGYLRASSERAGLEVLDVRQCVSRLEMGEPVASYVAVLQAPPERT
jgi:predicted TPR repeat methyltransferase